MLRTLGIIALLSFAISTTRADDPKLAERTKGNYDISFQPFAGGKKLDRKMTSDILRLEDTAKKWSLVFDRNDLPDNLPLNDTRVGTTTTGGYLTVAVDSIRTSDPTSEVLRSEIMDMGKYRVGMMVATIKGPDNNRQLLQRALIEVTSRLYYGISMTSPAPEKNLDQDPGVKEAAAIFRAMVDTVQPVDLSKIREDQDQRLFRTRALFVEWNAKRLTGVLENEQFFRIRHEGKDVGYFQVMESVSKLPPILVTDQQRLSADKTIKDRKNLVDNENLSGLRVEMRMHTVPDTDKTTDTESSFFVTTDRAHEIWSNLVTSRDAKGKTPVEKEMKYTEVGSTDRLQERVFDKDLKPNDFKEADKTGELPYRMVETYTLKVSSETNTADADDIQRQLPPFYLPQALGWLLPRLLPLDRQTGYMFATYSSDNRQIMLEYVDVGIEKDVMLAGKKYRAIPVSIRVGDEGSTTIHYVTPAGKYLGSNNPTTMTEMSVIDQNTLLTIWKDADLSPKKAVK